MPSRPICCLKMSIEAVDIVKLAVSQLSQISDVVEENVQISHNTKDVSSDMADITGNLLELIES